MSWDDENYEIDTSEADRILDWEEDEREKKQVYYGGVAVLEKIFSINDIKIQSLDKNLNKLFSAHHLNSNKIIESIIERYRTKISVILTDFLDTKIQVFPDKEHLLYPKTLFSICMDEYQSKGYDGSKVLFQNLIEFSRLYMVHFKRQYSVIQSMISEIILDSNSPFYKSDSYRSPTLQKIFKLNICYCIYKILIAVSTITSPLSENTLKYCHTDEYYYMDIPVNLDFRNVPFNNNKRIRLSFIGKNRRFRISQTEYKTEKKIRYKNVVEYEASTITEAFKIYFTDQHLDLEKQIVLPMIELIENDNKNIFSMMRNLQGKVKTDYNQDFILNPLFLPLSISFTRAIWTRFVTEYRNNLYTNIDSNININIATSLSGRSILYNDDLRTLLCTNKYTLSL